MLGTRGDTEGPNRALPDNGARSVLRSNGECAISEAFRHCLASLIAPLEYNALA